MSSNNNDSNGSSSSSSYAQPSNSMVTPLLTDLYQLTMAYSYWKNGKHEDEAVFELFFRKNPFKGNFTVFCGLDECLKILANFSFSEDDVAYLKSIPSMSLCEPAFFDYLLTLDASQMHVAALQEGTVAFPRTPLLILRGPLAVGQLLETTLLNLVNYPSLVATNAARMVRAAGSESTCIEFGLRRAQGPDGACSASKYSYLGGFAGTSNLQAGKMFDIPVSGTHAHAFVQSFTGLDQVESVKVMDKNNNNEPVEILPKVLEYRGDSPTNDGELAAFVAYAGAYPHNFLCLVDTYDTVRSGLVNFIAVAKVLDDLGYAVKGIRLDSGDLVALSIACRDVLREVAKERPGFANLNIVASNDINEKVLLDLASKEHGITSFGIGTNLVTCQAQPALGCVFKLVELNGKPRIKLSQEIGKATIPGRKRMFRLYKSDKMVLDYMMLADEPTPTVGDTLVCRHPGIANRRVTVRPQKVQELQTMVYSEGRVVASPTSIHETRNYVQEQLADWSLDGGEYPVMVSVQLYRMLSELWEHESPIHELE